MKLVIAPHVVSDSHLREILDKVKTSVHPLYRGYGRKCDTGRLFDYRLLRTAVLHLPIW